MRYSEKAFILSNDRVFARMLVLSTEKYCQTEFCDYANAESIISKAERADVIIFDKRYEFSTQIEKILSEKAKVFLTVSSNGTGDFNIPFDISEFERVFEGLLSGREEIPKSEKKEDFILYEKTLSASFYGKKVSFTKKEFALLKLLYENRGKIVSAETIKQSVFGGKDSNNVNVYIKYLRKKLDESIDKKLIYTVRGKGFTVKLKEGENL